ncbi:MAG: hypothetical protein Q8O35_13445 [Humidesulfovibrio sp.]|jgi:hypothetical protein|uniref:hypothetical protein n=1 Tax=Humidesulfovibrio sp. TaxID=2910988 RepID=UPI00273770FA|nr:hypothetical protein [Humidesulfovibrio sp.]MDP2849175.1 hypothetical protein [Humidesulfovibrio sp.]
MRIIWRTLPRLALPAAIGLGLAYLGTGFLPRPEAALRPPEELRAMGQGLAEESPVRAILERNVLHLESPAFKPPDSPLAPPAEPAAAAAALTRPLQAETQQNQTEAAFAPLEFVLLPNAGRNKKPSVLSGGPHVQGLVVAPTNGTGAAGVEGFRLVGVVAGGARPTAMLQVDGAAVTLRPGDQAKGWTLQSVEAERVTLRKGHDLRVLPLAGTKQ